MIIPPYLKPGDKVGVVAPAKKVDRKKTLAGIQILESWGLEVIFGHHVFDSFHQFSGTDEQRAADLQGMINHPEIKAVFMARGGYGSTRIVDQINYNSLKSKPKWICGFSDITAFHLHLFNIEIASLHSPMPSTFHCSKSASMEKLKKFLFGESATLEAGQHPDNKIGKAKGKIVGGNLSIICTSIGTTSEINTNGNILFIEDVGEQLYHLDRMMVQLKRAGALSNLAGLIVGQFSEMEDQEDSFGLDSNQIIHSHMQEFDFPVAHDFPIGHTSENMPIPIGMEAVLTVDVNSATLRLDR